jgi:hypothetical protein
VGSEVGESATTFPGEEGTPGQCAHMLAVALVAAPSVSEEEEAGWGPRGSERRGWRRLGRSKAKARWGGRPVAGPGRRRRPKRGGGGVGRWRITRAGRKRKEVGPKSLLGLKSKGVKGKSI